MSSKKRNSLTPRRQSMRVAIKRSIVGKTESWEVKTQQDSTKSLEDASQKDLEQPAKDENGNTLLRRKTFSYAETKLELPNDTQSIEPPPESCEEPMQVESCEKIEPRMSSLNLSSENSLPSLALSPDKKIQEVQADDSFSDSQHSSQGSVQSLIVGCSDSSPSGSSLRVSIGYKVINILSWCLDGLESFLYLNGQKVIEDESAEIICFQNLVCDEDDPLIAHLNAPEGYKMYYQFGSQSSSLAVMTSEIPVAPPKKTGIELLDEFSSVMVLEFRHFTLLNVMAPSGRSDLRDLPKKLGWFDAFMGFLERLPKAYVIAGNLRISLEEIDIGNKKYRRHLEGSTHLETQKLQQLLDLGLVDCFRHFHPDETDAYTHYTSYAHQGRIPQYGRRDDFFLVPRSFLTNIRSCFIDSSPTSFQHCPVLLSLSLIENF